MTSTIKLMQQSISCSVQAPTCIKAGSEIIGDAVNITMVDRNGRRKCGQLLHVVQISLQLIVYLIDSLLLHNACLLLYF